MLNSYRRNKKMLYTKASPPLSMLNRVEILRTSNTCPEAPAPKAIIELCSPEPESDSDSSPASKPETKEIDHLHSNETSIMAKRKVIDESYESKNPPECEERDSKRGRRV